MSCRGHSRTLRAFTQKELDRKTAQELLDALTIGRGVPGLGVVEGVKGGK